MATLGLIAVCAFGVRKLQSGGLAKSASVLRVLATTNVGTKERVVLMGVRDKTLLIGVTPGSIRLIATLDDDTTNPVTEDHSTMDASHVQ